MENKFFDCDEFERNMEKIRSDDGITSPLKLGLCVVCGSLSSLLDLKKMILDIYGCTNKNKDITEILNENTDTPNPPNPENVIVIDFTREGRRIYKKKSTYT